MKGWNIYAEGALRLTNNKTTQNKIPIYNYNVANEPMLRDSGYGTVTYVYDNRYKQNYYAVNVYTDYSHSFGKHNGKVLLGLNYERYNQDNMWASGTDLTTEDKPFLSQTQSNKKNGDGYWNRATAGYFGRFNYDYDGKYLAEFNIRYDGSSRFLADKRWAWFPSVSLGWNIAREEFFEKLSETVNTLKLRGSWGQLGNTSSNYNSFWDWYPFYQQQAISSASSNWLINGEKQNTSSLPSIVNAIMTWETVETWDFGFDFGAFNNRLTGTFDWYSRTTKDMIGPAPILGSVLGTNAPKTNNCDMRTSGWELEIGWRDQINDFKYGVRFNLSDNRSKILTYPYDGEFSNQSIGGYYNGKYLNEIWGYESVGLASSKVEMDNWLTTNKPNWGSNWGAGDVMYKDLNGDGIVSSGANTLDDHGDLKRIGNATPRYRIGLNLDAAYKGFDFSIFFQGVLKRDWFFGAVMHTFGERKEICGKAPALKIIWTIGRKTILVHIIRNLILAVFRKISRHRRVICKVPPISVARISSWGILCRNLCCHRPESVIAAFICHAIIYSLSLVCPIYLIPKLSEDMVTKDGAVVKLIRCNVLFLWV